MPHSIPKGLTREHILNLADLDAGIEHSFGEPNHVQLIHVGKRYAPKAIIGIAFRHLTGEKATFSSMGGDKVRLTKEDGSTITVERGKLSDADQEYIESLR